MKLSTAASVTFPTTHYADEDPALLKSTKDQEHFAQYTMPPVPAQSATPMMTTSNPFLAAVPTVGYMGHKPVYRKPIVSICGQDGQHFDLAMTKAANNLERDQAGLSQGFVQALQKEVTVSTTS